LCIAFLEGKYVDFNLGDVTMGFANLDNVPWMKLMGKELFQTVSGWSRSSDRDNRQRASIGRFVDSQRRALIATSVMPGALH